MPLEYIAFQELEKINIEDLLNIISTSNKKAIGELKLIDLVYNKQSMTGVYIIFDENSEPVYVGKTGSRAILERLAGHFDLRPEAYMNSFLCALAGKRKQRRGPHATDEDILNVYENALMHKFLFIQIPNTTEHKKKITKLESILSKKLNTKYNSKTGKDTINIKTMISDL